MASVTQSSGASLSDILSAIKNLVLSCNAIAQNYLNVEGSTIASAIGVPTVVKASAGRVARVSVTVNGSAAGTIYDGATLNATTKPIYIIPEAVGLNVVKLPCAFGILVVPGSGMIVSVSYS
jgi:hypothetical protein